MDFSINDIFANKKLKGVFMQFGRIKNAYKRYSNLAVKTKVVDFLKGYFSGAKTTISSHANADIVIEGGITKANVIKQVKDITIMIEQLLSVEGLIRKNIVRNGKDKIISLPYASIQDILDKTINRTGKRLLYKRILDNFNYNLDLATLTTGDEGGDTSTEDRARTKTVYNLNKVYNLPPKEFKRRQNEWARRNGKELI